MLNRYLRRMIQKEDFAGSLDAMTPRQLEYAWLLSLSDGEIAQLLGLSDRTAVSATLRNARLCIAQHRPDLARYVTGRKANCRPRKPQNRPLDWSWITEED